MIKRSVSPDDKKFLLKLGSRLRTLRHEKGWTLEETEEHGWNDWVHLQRIESGKNITVVTLRKVAKIYKIPLSKLLEGL